MSGETSLIVVDDDQAVRDSIAVLLESAGYTVQAYASAKALLDQRTVTASCLIVDMRMPQMDGMELQEELKHRGIDIPVIIMTGHGDVPLAVRAMRAGAIDFIEKPFDDDVMLTSICRAIAHGRRTRDHMVEARAAQSLLSHLTPRETHVLEQLVAGRSNKMAAFELGISPRTIEIHRAHIMNKMRANSLSDLVRASLAAERLVA